MNRAKIENTLMAIGMKTGIKGFNYIADAVEYIGENGQKDLQVTKDIYPAIAEKRSTTASRVERAIRHAFETVRESGNKEMVEKYIGINDKTNFGSLVYLTKKIEQECEDSPAEEGEKEQSLEMTEETVRRIFREEFRKVLGELHGEKVS